MKPIPFYKYHGAGNDFIVFDQRHHTWIQPEQQDLMAALCHRRMGIGADGLLLLQPHEELDFEMVYFNSDGLPGTFCGNGGRCITDLAHRLGHIGTSTRFMASDGIHEAHILGKGQVRLMMRPTAGILPVHAGHAVDTGSMHYVQFVNDVTLVDVARLGADIRYHDDFGPAGTNVNFVEIIPEGLRVRTYERGVEAETWACGTGVVAAALTYLSLHSGALGPVTAFTRGGVLSVSAVRSESGWTAVSLTGPTQLVYMGWWKGGQTMVNQNTNNLPKLTD